jgi:zinc transport system substrate-binding protein
MRIVYFVLCTFLITHSAQAAEGKVVATIKPLHSLVAAVMAGSGDSPLLLVEGKNSPHNFTLKPSQVAALQSADIIFTIGDNFELFMQKILPTLPKRVTRVALDKEAELIFQTVRQGKDFDPDAHSAGETRDLHYWLLSNNAEAMVMEIARQLSIIYPDKREIYFTNARKINERIEAEHLSIDSRVAPLRGKPFIVFHDAFQYFEKEYGLKAVGSIMLHPGEPPGAKHIGEIREKIKTLGAVCVFREPSFEGKIVDNLIEGTGAKSGVLDPEGALLPPGPELYFQLIENIAAGLEKCLS